MDIFSTRLKSLRKTRKISQKKLAEYLGLSIRMISQYENGYGRPSFEIVVTLAAYFHVTTDYLLGADNRHVACLDKLTPLEQGTIYEIIECLINESTG